MKIKYQTIYWIGLTMIFICSIFWFLKNFNLSWVETSDNESKITINFLIPMDQEALKEHIKLLAQREDSSEFEYTLKWLNNHVVEIKMHELNKIKGQNVKLLIHNTPTQIKGLTKSETVNVKFQSDIEILFPSDTLLISSSRTFVIQFNTPISLNQIHKYLQSDAKFYIDPYKDVDSNGRKYTDDTKYILSPKEPLKNGKCYVLLIKSGMCSKSGTLLEKDQGILLQVDKIPTILETYPIDGAKWIGLYPKFTLVSKEPIMRATASINGQDIEGTLVDSKHAYFLLDDLLKPETTYQIEFQIQVESGELSQAKPVSFSTTTLNKNRFWIEVHCDNNQKINCYEGNKLIRTISCSIKSKKSMPTWGTYYLQGKAEVYENNKNKIGANYWMSLNEDFGIHGDTRNAYWQLIDHSQDPQNIVISDEEAEWLYHRMNGQNMIIIRK